MGTIKSLARENYNQTKTSISFDDLYEHFNQGESLTEIGERYNLSRERIRQIYNKHFKRLFNHKTGMQRRKESNAKAYKQQLFNKNPIVKKLADICDKKGFSFKPILLANQIGYKHNRFIINGKQCFLIITNTATNFSRQKKGAKYSRINLSDKMLQDTDVVIVWQGIRNRFFVYPSVLLSMTYALSKGFRALYLPVAPEAKGMARKLSHDDYLENWDLLQD